MNRAFFVEREAWTTAAAAAAAAVAKYLWRPFFCGFVSSRFVVRRKNKPTIEEARGVGDDTAATERTARVSVCTHVTRTTQCRLVNTDEARHHSDNVYR